MTTLGKLDEHREQILLAEIGALLHNLGKLDPNFLNLPKEKLGEHHLHIPSYRFDRFAAPDPDLLMRAKEEITDEKWKHPNDFTRFRTLLLKSNDWDPSHQAAVQALLGDWDGEKDNHPWVVRVIEAAWRFNLFVQGAGPLYRCFVARRQQEKTAAEGKLGELDEQIEKIKRERETTVPARRAELGSQIGKLYQQKSALEKTIDSAEPSHEVLQEEDETQSQLEAEFRRFVLEVGQEQWPLCDLLTLFWDAFFYKPKTTQYSEGDDYQRRYALEPWLDPKQRSRLPALLILSHGEMSGAEKAEADPKSPSWEHLRFATAFGYERKELDKWALHDARHHLLDAALHALATPSKEYPAFVSSARETLAMGLGDTRWPINEINLWDYASTIAALFKSGVARTVLIGTIPTVDGMRWRFLSLRFDGLGYLSQVHHITDLLGRHRVMTTALDSVQALLEQDYPLGNQVYRDENGIVLVVADLPDRDVLGLTDKAGETLERLLQRAFAEAEEGEREGAALVGELAPALGIGPAVRGKALSLGEYLREEPLPLAADVEAVANWWRGERGKDKEICTVCGVRPVGYKAQNVKTPKWVDPDKAERRHGCCVCLHRRGRRARDWLTKPHTTIWTDEITDVNGRLALIVGHFDLDDWLDGTLIPTMQKPVSFARIRRMWGTTRAFWHEVLPIDKDRKIFESLAAGRIGQAGPRLKIQGALRPHRPNDTLGPYHTYELILSDGIRLSVVWDSNEGRFITCDNLAYLASPEQLGKPVEEIVRPGRCFRLEEPTGYGGANRRLGTITVEEVTSLDQSYAPVIPILAQPRTFMALVPADRALDVVGAIKQKYEREMGKVRNRLPLHLGVVYAGRRTPLRAVLEAGRRILERPMGDGLWRVMEKPHKQTGPFPKKVAYLAKGTKHFDEWYAVKLEDGQNERRLTWYVPAVMGDGTTEDVWYPYVFVETDGDDGKVAGRQCRFKSFRPTSNGSQPCWLVHVSELQEGDEVYFTPSTFDFEWLDTAGRRFEIVYDDDGRRPGRLHRPYLLDEMAALEKAWSVVGGKNGLTTTQIHALRDLIRAKREEWRPSEGDGQPPEGIFYRFCRDAIITAQWPKGHRPKGEYLDRLTTWAVSGLLEDVIELYMEVMKQRPIREREEVSS